ncbi:MAG: hypothetical protein WAV73_03725 [Candidatus Moraniibacteriota bacterium]
MTAIESVVREIPRPVRDVSAVRLFNRIKNLDSKEEVGEKVSSFVETAGISKERLCGGFYVTLMSCWHAKGNKDFAPVILCALFPTSELHGKNARKKPGEEQ